MPIIIRILAILITLGVSIGVVLLYVALLGWAWRAL